MKADDALRDAQLAHPVECQAARTEIQSWLAMLRVTTPHLLWPDGEISAEAPSELRPDADLRDTMFSHWSDQLSAYAPRGSNRPQRDQWVYIKGFKRMPVNL